MISARDLRLQVIRPTLSLLDLGGDAAEELLLGTALQESGCGTRLVQGHGPALGVWQMEPRTHEDIWARFLVFRPGLGNKVLSLACTGLSKESQLIGNLNYACAMARVQYFRSPQPLPAAGDWQAQGYYYKMIYNTRQGAATEAEYASNAQAILRSA